ncbi:hypothetical protein FGB62_174g04 [Gracilaria domingensis]|nr:hypothetical protein FGB62_174g04 [Gracilaria domingensis]
MALSICLSRRARTVLARLLHAVTAAARFRSRALCSVTAHNVLLSNHASHWAVTAVGRAGMCCSVPFQTVRHRDGRGAGAQDWLHGQHDRGDLRARVRLEPVGGAARAGARDPALLRRRRGALPAGRGQVRLGRVCAARLPLGHVGGLRVQRGLGAVLAGRVPGLGRGGAPHGGGQRGGGAARAAGAVRQQRGANVARAAGKRRRHPLLRRVPAPPRRSVRLPVSRAAPARHVFPSSTRPPCSRRPRCARVRVAHAATVWRAQLASPHGVRGARRVSPPRRAVARARRRGAPRAARRRRRAARRRRRAARRRRRAAAAAGARGALAAAHAVRVRPLPVLRARAPRAGAQEREARAGVAGQRRRGHAHVAGGPQGRAHLPAGRRRRRRARREPGHLRRRGRRRALRAARAARPRVRARGRCGRDGRAGRADAPPHAPALRARAAAGVCVCGRARRVRAQPPAAGAGELRGQPGAVGRVRGGGAGARGRAGRHDLLAVALLAGRAVVRRRGAVPAAARHDHRQAAAPAAQHSRLPRVPLHRVRHSAVRLLRHVMAVSEYIFVNHLKTPPKCSKVAKRAHHSPTESHPHSATAVKP